MAGFGLLTLIVGFSTNGAVKAIQMLAVIGLGAVIMISVVVLSLVHFADWQSPASEEDFETIVRRGERLAVEALGATTPDEDDDDEYEIDDEEDFRALVRAAVDELPLEFHRALEHVAVVVCRRRRRVRAPAAAAAAPMASTRATRSSRTTSTTAS